VTAALKPHSAEADQDLHLIQFSGSPPQTGLRSVYACFCTAQSCDRQTGAPRYRIIGRSRPHLASL